jgi:hypothetical protein
MIAFLLAAATCAANIQIDFAPDQPLPYVYTDDPLIIEFQSNEDVKASARIAIESPGAVAFEHDLGQISLRAKGTRWISVENAPKVRGRFIAKVSVDAAGSLVAAERAICRIDRPGATSGGDLSASLPADDAKTLLALRNVPVRFVRVDVANYTPDRIAEISKMGFQIVAGLTLTTAPQGEELARLIAETNPFVTRWEIESGERIDRITSVTDLLAKSGPSKSIALVVSRADILGALLVDGKGPRITDIVIETPLAEMPNIEQYRAVAEAAGYEGLVYSVRCEGLSDTPGIALSQLVRSKALGAARIEFDGGVFYANNECGAEYAALSAFSHRFDGASYIGLLSAADGIEAHIFRKGPNWIASVQSKSNSTRASIRVGEASNVTVADVYNNPIEAPAVANGSVAIEVPAQPVYVMGTGGDAIARAAWSALQMRARELADRVSGSQSLPGEIAAATAQLSQTNAPSSNRAAFFVLLKSLPEIERGWHAGVYTRDVAVPTMAGVSRVARAMCTLEQETGEPFIDPQVDTLGRASEYQSHFFTGISESNAVHERGEVVMREVSLLVAESKAIADGGRAVEGQALAALAEWRARSLEHAAKAAPLSQPEPKRPASILAETPAAAPTAPQPQVQPSVPPPATVAATPAVAPPEEKSRKEYKVVKGDTPGGIAKKHGVKLDDLMKWNNWKKTPRLKIGQTVVVYAKE